MLWQRKQKWHHFDNGILAINGTSATFLKDWYYTQSINGFLAGYFEVLDLHRYKKVTAKTKVQAAMREKHNEAFVFFPCKN
ncbi:MAG: hypothetical protein WC716_15550 [Chitinophagaceae bacterium]|jgi:hypothetical protein